MFTLLLFARTHTLPRHTRACAYTYTYTRTHHRPSQALELPADGSILPRPDELPAVFVGAASAKDDDWPRRHPGKAAIVVLAPVRAYP